MDTIDDKIPMNAKMILFDIAIVVNTVVVISYSLPIFLTAVIPVGILFFIMQVHLHLI